MKFPAPHNCWAGLPVSLNEELFSILICGGCLIVYSYILNFLRFHQNFAQNPVQVSSVVTIPPQTQIYVPT